MTSGGIRPASDGTDPDLVCRTDHQPTATRTCTKCSTQKPLEAFAKDQSRPAGRRSVCAECRADYDREADYRRRSRKHGHEPMVVPFTTRQVVERYGDRCIYCGTGPFEHIDHVRCVAAGGHHTLENAVPCCAACNRRKQHNYDALLIRVFRVLKATEVAS
jgi:HNH endonuclease